MKFDAHYGVYIYLILPSHLFIIILATTYKFAAAQDIFIIPILNDVWVAITMVKVISFNYNNDFSTSKSKEEITVLLLSLTPWVMRTIIDFFDIRQAVEAFITKKLMKQNN